MASSSLSSSDLTEYMFAEDILDIATVGDLIEIERQEAVFKHWVVYIGNGYVIHVYLTTKFATSATVQRDKLIDICVRGNGDRCRINNLTQLAAEKNLTPKPSSQIVKYAESAVGMDVEYRLLSDNCEYFATACRYGEAFCGQVESSSDSFINWGTYGIVGSAVLVVIGLFLRIAGQNRQRS